jgi:hypothetical protein
MDLKGKNIKYCVWNVNGLISRGNNKLDDHAFRTQIANYDIVGLVETHLEDSISVNFENFSIYRKSRVKLPKAKRCHGGIIVLVNNSIRQGIKHLDTRNENYHWIKLSKSFFSLEKDVYICIAHVPPQHSTYTIRTGDTVLEEIARDITNYGKMGNIILSGDINARTGTKADFIINDDEDNEYMDKLNNHGTHYKTDNHILTRGSQDSCISSRGYNLLELCTESQLRILNGRTFGDCFGKLTCHNSLGSSVVDYAIVSENLLNDILCFKVHNFDATLSDHCKISLVLQVNIKWKIGPNPSTSPVNLSPLPNKFHWTSTSAMSYQTAFTNKVMAEKITTLNDNIVNAGTTVDGNTDLLSDLLITAAKRSLKPKRQPTNNSKPRRRHQPWFNSNLHTLRKSVQAGSRQLARDPYNPFLRSLYFRDLKQYNKLRKKAFRVYKANLLTKLEQLEEHDPKQFWALLDDLKGNKTERNPSPNITNTDWFNHFNNLNTLPDKIIKLEERYKQLLQNKPAIFNELCYSISSSEIAKAIHSLKNGKATGVDGISNEMIKVAHPYILPSVTKLFNKVLTTSVYPKCWSVGYIIPVFKSNNPDDTNNYRGITVNSCMGKLFNKVLNQRLDTFLEEHSLIHDCQIGFKKKARTADHIFVLKTLIDRYLNNGKKMYTCFIDFTKAFDKVSRACLLSKLCDIGVGGVFLKTIQSMFDSDQVCVRLGNKLTPYFKSLIGVRQGDPLSANLFKIVVNDIPTLFDKTCLPVLLENRRISCLLYADDIVLLSETAGGLQKSLNLLQEHCENIGLTINTSKSKIMTFCKGGKKSNQSFTVGGETLDIVDNYKYLGIVFTPSGSFTAAKEHLYKKSLKAHFKLKKALYGINNHKLAMHLFDHTVSPILLYGAEVWGAFNSTTTNIDQMKLRDIYSHSKILNTQRKFARFLLGVPKQCPIEALHGELGWSPIYSKIAMSVIKYWHRIANEEEGSLLSEALQVHAHLKSKDVSNILDVVEQLVCKLSIKTPLSALKQYTDSQITHIIKNNVHNTIEVEWLDVLNKPPNANKQQGNKLRTYNIFKSQFKLESYLLHVKNKAHRKSLCQLRTSTHPLRIEKGRHIGLNVVDRICQHCSQIKVEDEFHFVFECSLYQQERSTFLQNVYNKFPNIEILQPNKQFLWIMSAEDSYVNIETAKFVHNCLQLREQHGNTP